MTGIDLSGYTALITGGTKGIGYAAALELAKAGVQTFLTFKWGTAEEEEIKKEFSEINAPVPVLIQADVSVSEDTDLVMQEIRKKTDKIDIFISNVGFAQRTMSLDDYKKRSLYKTLDYSTWPLIEYTQKIKEVFGKYPKKVLAISSNGPDHFYQGYDYVAASKALLEHFTRYLSVHLFPEGSRVNAIRFGTVRTESFNAIFGEEFFDYITSNGLSEDMILTPEDCGKAIFAFCSGYLDAVSGQVINVDYGLPFQDNSMMRYLQTKK